MVLFYLQMLPTSFSGSQEPGHGGNRFFLEMTRMELRGSAASSVHGRHSALSRPCFTVWQSLGTFGCKAVAQI